MESIVVLDFGSQTAQLISRRIRDLGVYSEILPGPTRASDLEDTVRGIVLSGSPASIHDVDAPQLDPAILELDVPILGICYGLQKTVAVLGGSVGRSERREFGRSRIRFQHDHSLFAGVPDGFTSWMSHGDHVAELPDNAQVVAESENGVPAAISIGPHFIGIQFHPEVTHCEFGTEILSNFAFGLCSITERWSMSDYADLAAAEIRDHVGQTPVLLLISGGVDSTVVAALLLRALPTEQVFLMYVDTGLMRKYETEEVRESLRSLGASNLEVVDASEEFLSALGGISDPEKKREVIGDRFIAVQEQHVSRLLSGDYFLAQGTLYTDMIESGAGVGKNAHVIKSHHNVRSPLVQQKREAGRVIEPLSRLYKDEVRALGRLLGVPDAIINRHPFPGPGLAVRILGEVTAEKCRVLRDCDRLFMSELKKRGLYDKIWQAFAVLLPIRAVGVTGDSRSYGFVVALRAVTSSDGMTADVYPIDTNDLLEISAAITNAIPEIGRVVYDVSSKPPATIEWE